MTDSKQTIAHIKGHLKRRKPVTEALTITPEVAAFLLELKWDGNRNVQQSVVDRYASEMRHGNWMMTGEPIIISWDGKVIDGQHRLWAMFDSKVTVEANIAFGIDPAAFSKIDSGSARSLAYRAGMPPAHAAALNFLVKTVFGAAESSDSALRLIDPIYGPHVSGLIALQSRKIKVLRAAPVVAAGAIWCESGLTAYVQELYTGMISLETAALPPIAKSFLRQTMETAPHGLDLFVRAFRAFDPQAAQLTKLLHKGAIPTLEHARQLVAEAMKRHRVSFDSPAVVTQRGVKKGARRAA